MSPLERQVQELEKIVQSLLRVENIEFVKNLERRIPFKAHKLSDHLDVSGTDSASTGQVLKKTAGDWQPGTDNVV